MLAMNIPSGHYRPGFAFMNWADYDAQLWERVKEQADLEMGEMDSEIYASDRSAKAIGITRRNLKNAGLHKDIDVKVGYFDEIRPHEQKGLLMFNPPYGKRLEERGDIVELYKKIGDTLKQQFSGFEAWIITADIEQAKFIGLKPSKKIVLYNGPIEARLLKFEMYQGSKRGGDRPGEKGRSYNRPGQPHRKGKRTRD
jgi:putative N6-adenine-specific DNA methylase